MKTSSLHTACIRGLAILVGLAGIYFWGARPAQSEESAAPNSTAGADLDRGRYLIKIGGCNDCHTPGFMQTPGQIPESEWLTGVPMGWRGPWGTTYAANLRLRVHELSENEWVQLLQTRKALPPMPWFSVNSLSEPDARAIYRYISSLGAKGEHMPVNVPPDEEPKTPYLNLNPENLPRDAAVNELRRETPSVPR